ncbi:hypothetical protein IE53DRAFT_124399 [Violaceomyces palustris]|uniref:Uncharacterized protein n=1 Tax=Violaceomyces palustris TaxID=1673888 RepID=A0ACD0NVG7_9BASI|nr:hypothetical protein IE53DRAFT_124399 [Violaceomyces palustris]
MGIVCSRPISNFLEDAFLKVAQLIDYLSRLSNKYFQYFVGACISPFIASDSDYARGKRVQRLCLPGDGGVCLIPANQAERRREEKKRKIERRKRAEAAALGVEIVRRKSRSSHPAASDRARLVSNASEPASPVSESSENERIRVTLGQPARAPPPRPAVERETAAERARGKLWVMGNVQPSQGHPLKPLAVSVSMDGSSYLPRPATTTESFGTTRATGEALLHDVHRQRQIPDRGARQSGSDNLTFDVIASSGNTLFGQQSERVDVAASEPKPRRREPKGDTAEIRPRVSSKPRNEEVAPPAMASVTERDEETRSSNRAAIQPALAAPLKLSPAPLSPPFKGIRSHVQQVRPEQLGHKSKLSLDTKLNRAKTDERMQIGIEISKGTTTTTTPSPKAKLLRLSGSFKPRQSLDLSVPQAGAWPARQTEASGDRASSVSSNSCAPSPLVPASTGVAELASRACLSARDASRKTRKVWKDEVDKIALQRVQVISRRHQASLAGKGLDSRRLNLMGYDFDEADSPSSTSAGGLKRRHSEKVRKRASGIHLSKD